MAIYLASFFVSYIFLKLIRKTGKISTSQKTALSLLALMIVSFVAAFRNYKIGTDTINYLASFNSIKVYSNGDFYIKSSTFEPLWFYYVFFLAKLNVSDQVFLGLTSFIMLANVYVAVRIYGKIRPEDCVLAFLLLFFNVSLNLMRQCFAMSFFLISLAFLYNSKYRSSICFLLISFLIHNIFFIGFLFVIFDVVLKKSKLQTIKKLVYGIPLFLLLFMNMIILLFKYSGIVPARYIAVFLNGITIDYSTSHLITFIYPVAVAIIYFNKLIKSDLKTAIWLLALFIQTVLYQLRDPQNIVYRIVMVFQCSNVFLFPELYDIGSQKYLLKNSMKGKSIIAINFSSFLYFYLIAYWVFYYVIRGYQATVPYISIFT